MSENSSEKWPVKGWKPLDDYSIGAKEGERSSNGPLKGWRSIDDVGQVVIEPGKEKSGSTERKLAAKPTIIGINEKPHYSSIPREAFSQLSLPEDIESIEIESLNANSEGIAVRRAGEMGLSNCQDCFAVKVNHNTGERSVVVCDGVGNTIAGAEAAAIVAATLVKDINTPPEEIAPVIHLDEEKAKELLPPFLPDDTKEYLFRKHQSSGVWGSTTAAAVLIKEDRLIYRMIGDGGIIVIRSQKDPRRLEEAKVVFSNFNFAERAPAQLACTTDGAWELRRGEKKGAVQVEKGDVVLVFTDGFLKQEEFKGLSLEQLSERLVSDISWSRLIRTSKASWPEILANDLFEIGAPGEDDATLAVIVV